MHIGASGKQQLIYYNYYKVINTDNKQEDPHYHMFRNMHKIIQRCLFSSSSRRGIQSLFQRQISRDVGQPTSYSHPELLASDESEYGIVK